MLNLRPWEKVRRAPKATFTPNPDYQGPPIQLTCGRHTKQGRFIPKNVELTKIERLRWYSDRHVDAIGRIVYRPFPMVGDPPSRKVEDIYAYMMKQK